MIATVLWVCIFIGTPCQTPEQEVAYLKQLTREIERVVVPHIHTSSDISVYRGMGNGTTDVERWRDVVAVFFPDAVETALCLMRAESGGNPNALSSSNARGLMQVHAPSWAAKLGLSYDDLYDPVTNLSAALYVYDHFGWSHWNPWQRGSCR